MNITFYLVFCFIKYARSVSLYPYNQRQILQNIKYTKDINIAKVFAKYCGKNVFMDKR